MADPLAWNFSYSGILSSQWELVGGSDKHLDFRVEPASDCSGENPNQQYTTATTDITLLDGQTLAFDWDVINTTETQNIGFDHSQVTFDGVVVSSLSSVSDGGGCVTENLLDSGAVNVTNNSGGNKIYTLELLYNTGDSFWHSSAVGVDFQITNYTITPDPTTTTTPPPSAQGALVCYEASKNEPNDTPSVPHWVNLPAGTTTNGQKGDPNYYAINLPEGTPFIDIIDIDVGEFIVGFLDANGFAIDESEGPPTVGIFQTVTVLIRVPATGYSNSSDTIQCNISYIPRGTTNTTFTTGTLPPPPTTTGTGTGTTGTTCKPCIPQPPTTTPTPTGTPSFPSFTTRTLPPIIIPGTPVPPELPLTVPSSIVTTTSTTTTTTTTTPSPTTTTGTLPIECNRCNRLGY